MNCSDVHLLNASQFKNKKTKRQTQNTQVLCVVLSTVSWLDEEECAGFPGSCSSNVASAAVSQFPSGQLLITKCLLIWDNKNLAVIVKKNEDLENQPSFNCNLILSARSSSIAFACASLDSQLAPKVLAALGPLPSSGLAENIKET